MFDDVNDFSFEELERLFGTKSEQESSTANEETDTPAPQPTDDTVDTDIVETDDKSIENSKAFAKRLSEKTEQVRKQEREAIAKELGYESYEDMIKSRERKTIEEKGLDPDEVSPVIDELVKARLDNDPRMKELETLRQRQVEEFGKRELAEITKLTDGEITSLAQLPKEVLELWKTKGSLKSAYLELEGEKLILKARREHSKGSTSHLANPAGVTTPPSNKRPLTNSEKQMWKYFNPQMTDEEINKITVDK